MPDLPSPVIVLFRDDLRLNDHPALTAAVASGAPVLAIFVLDQTDALRAPGGASKWWLHHSLTRLSESLSSKGGRLTVLAGDPLHLIPDIALRFRAVGVFWNRRYGLAERNADAALKENLQARGITAKSFNGHLLREPWDVASKTGSHFRVFTPFYRALSTLGEPAAPLPAPKTVAGFDHFQEIPDRLSLDDLALLPRNPDWSGGIAAEWQPGEAGAMARLTAFLESTIRGYAEGRNLPDRLSTSKLSPHLRFGEISVRQVWHAAVSAFRSGRGPASSFDQETFLKELCWREFSYHLLYHHPDLAVANHQAKFDSFPWRDDPAGLKAWQRGKTGYPIVDAGMRELWQTGWMHNRVRMIVGSFLIKHLLLDWRLGECWFWDTLVDADPANNAASWQWVAGSGADAAPYFRIFNPVTQGERFDASAGYVRRFVPELGGLPDKVIHRPWHATPMELRAAGVKLGETYPVAVVDHEKARARALAAFKSISAAAA